MQMAKTEATAGPLGTTEVPCSWKSALPKFLARHREFIKGRHPQGKSKSKDYESNKCSIFFSQEVLYRCYFRKSKVSKMLCIPVTCRRKAFVSSRVTESRVPMQKKYFLKRAYTRVAPLCAHSILFCVLHANRSTAVF